MGYFETIWAADASKISVVIVGLFIVTFAATCVRLFDVTNITNVTLDALKLRLGSRINFIRQSANAMVFLGLIGTVIGFIVALQGIDTDSISHVNDVSAMVGNLVQGLGIALYTTLVGAIFSLWTTTNYFFLKRIYEKHLVEKIDGR